MKNYILHVNLIFKWKKEKPSFFSGKIKRFVTPRSKNAIRYENLTI